jgi:hypothetical protein
MDTAMVTPELLLKNISDDDFQAGKFQIKQLFALFVELLVYLHVTHLNYIVDLSHYTVTVSAKLLLLLFNLE